MSKEAYTIGETAWFKGEPVTVTTEPYKLYGGMWQDAKRQDGKTVMLPTPGQVRDNARQNQENWKRQQAAFRRLADAQS